MRLIEIESQKNGSHRNQTANLKTVPAGWAMVPDGMETTNFPFGEITTEEINGVMTVTSWKPGNIPDPEPISNPEPTTEERISALESAMLAMMEVQNNV